MVETLLFDPCVMQTHELDYTVPRYV
jgi:hypothetical protein